MSPANRIIRRTGVAGLVAVMTGAAVLAFGAGPASAKTTTLHFFSKAVSNSVFQANGQPITNQNAQPAPGDYFVSTDVDYVGNHKKHAKTSTGSDNLVCTFTTTSMGVCDAVIAVGGSVLLANHVTVDLTANSPVVPLNGGTGPYKGAHGTLSAAVVGNSGNSDFTVTYSN
jgi:hypothetical protein